MSIQNSLKPIEKFTPHQSLSERNGQAIRSLLYPDLSHIYPYPATLLLIFDLPKKP